MSEAKSALIIANYLYEDPDLRQLTAPAQDAESLARVLADRALSDFQVRTLINEPSRTVLLEIEDFCDNRKRDDLLLIYFSGHGIKDADGQLYFAAVDTRLVQHNVRRATAVSAQFMNEVMSRSRSRRQILLLDCCYSGAFKQGMLAKCDKRVGAGEQLEGQGRIVLTASDALQYSFEGGQVAGEGVYSVFTRTLVKGLETGEADLDRDGFFSIDQVYEYVCGRVADEQPEQKPTKMGYIEGRIFIGSNPRPRAAKLPDELLQTLESPLVWVRTAAVGHLATLMDSGSKGLALAAQGKLASVATNDDSQQVRTAAAKCLAAHGSLPAANNKTPPEMAGSSASVPEPQILPREGEAGKTEPLKSTSDLAAPRDQPASENVARSMGREAETEVKTPVALKSTRTDRCPGKGSREGFFVLRGHSDSVHSVVWSPDGKRLATGSEDGTAKVWDANTGRELLTLQGQSGIRSMAWNWNPEEAWLATATIDNRVTIWDAETGKQVVDDPQDGCLLAWRPGGNWLASAGGETGVVVRDLTTGEQLPIRYDGRIASLAWSPDGKLLAAGTWDSEKLAKVWDAESGKESLSLSGHDGGIYSVSWNPDGSRFASASNDGTVRVWDAGTGAQLRCLALAPEAGWNEVWAAAWSPDGRSLATGSQDGIPRVWDADAGDELLALGQHQGAVKSVAWSRDRQRLATGSEDNTARVWDAGKARTSQSKPETKDGRRLAAEPARRNSPVAPASVQGRAQPGSVLRPARRDPQTSRILAPGSGKELLALRGHTGVIWAVRWSPDGKRLATASDDKTAKVWNADTGRELLTLRGHRECVRSLDWNVNSEVTWLATASTDGSWKIWEADSGHE